LTLAVAIPLTGVLVYSIVNDSRQDERQIRITTLNLAQLVASQSQQFLADAEKLALRLSQHAVLELTHPNRRDPALDYFVDLHPQFANLVVSDASGRVVRSALPESLEQIGTNWIAQTIRTGRFTAGKPQFDPAIQRWICVLGQPLRNPAGQIIGALGMAVDLGRFHASVGPVSLPPDSIITIIDRDGAVMMRSPGAQAWIGKDSRGMEIVDYALARSEGDCLGKGLDGELRIYSFTSIPRIGWRVYVGIPAEFAFATARENALRASLMGTALLALAIALVLFLGRLLTQPMLVLARAATAAAEGRSEGPVPTTGPAEVAALATEFNRMLAIRLQREAEIRKLNAGLEERVQERTAALAERTGQLETANRELEAFSYSVSHDLRAPLRSIDGFTKALQEDHAANLPADARDDLNRVRAAARRMSQLIDELLKLSRISRLEMRRTPVNLSVLAAEIAAELQASDPARKAEFILQPDLVVNGSLELLRALLQNLLQNSWKFTRERVPARIELGTRQINGQTTFFVRDNGVGFDMSYADKLFGAFQRLHAVEEYEGTGIGLATVQRIVHRHGGKTWGEGKLNEGATFYFTLPDQERRL
jgi:signal transduction histidine kinase